MDVSAETEALEVIEHDKCILTTNYWDCFSSTADFPFFFSFHLWTGCSFLLFSPHTLFPLSSKAARRVENNIFLFHFFLFKNILEILIVESLPISYPKKLTGDYLYRLETQEYGSWKCSKLRIYLSQMPCISLFIKERLLNSAQGTEPTVLHILDKCSSTAPQPKLETRIALCEWDHCYHWRTTHLGISSKEGLI